MISNSYTWSDRAFRVWLLIELYQLCMESHLKLRLQSLYPWLLQAVRGFQSRTLFKIFVIVSVLCYVTLKCVYKSHPPFFSVLDLLVLKYIAQLKGYQQRMRLQRRLYHFFFRQISFIHAVSNPSYNANCFTLN